MGVLAWVRSHREAIALWVLAVLFASACVLLGRWQLDRYQDKHAKAQLVERNQARPAVPLTDVLPSPAAPLRTGDRYRAVTVRGTYDPDGTRLVRNRAYRGSSTKATFGYEIVVPLVLDDGSVLLVDRGWVPNGRSGSSPDVVPEPPAGTVTVVARLRASEPTRHQDLPDGQVGSVSVPQIAEGVGHPVYQAYGAALSETPAPPHDLARLDPVRTEGGEGINASYAVQWAVFALLGLGFPVWAIRRRREAAAEAAESARGEPALSGPDGSAGAAPGRSPVPVGRPRKRRQHVWNDEDE